MATEGIQFQLVEKLRQLPVVEQACVTSSDVYGRVKGYNDTMSWALQSAEGAVMVALALVAPLAHRLHAPLHAVDDKLCQGIDSLTERVPLVTEPADKIYESAKAYVSSTISPTVQQVTSFRDQGWNKANNVLANTQIGNIAMSGLDSTSSIADTYIDYFLPAENEDENIHTHPSAQCEDKILHTAHTVGTLSNKVGRRVYRTLSKRLSKQETVPRKTEEEEPAMKEGTHQPPQAEQHHDHHEHNEHHHKEE